MYTCRFSKFLKNGTKLDSDPYITLTNIKEINNFNHVWENLINIFEPNKDIQFIVSGFDELNPASIFLSIRDRKLELNIGKFIEEFGDNDNKFYIWNLEHCMSEVRVGDILVPQIIELKKTGNFESLYSLEL